MTSKVDTSDPNVRRLVYNMYRGMLGTYNDKANNILSALPKEQVCEDQGIARQLQSMMRQSSQTSGGGTPSPGTAASAIEGVTAPSFPAPPPPPPPGPGLLPTVRLNTEIPDTRGQLREPPAAIQNAMMTKDKKPFTYTPGGLDLSQIRSPRMQRRISRNAHSEGVGESQGAAAPRPAGPLPPSAMAAMQPQMAVPVFPTGGGSQLLHHVNTAPGHHALPPPPPLQFNQQQTAPPAPPPPTMVVPKTTMARKPEPPMQPPMPPPIQPPMPPPSESVIRSVSAPKQPYVPPTSAVASQNEPGSIYVPTVTSRAQLGSLYIPPISNSPQQPQEPSQQRPAVPSPQRPQTPQTASPVSPIHAGLNKAPTPWMSQQQRQQPQQVPAWVARDESPGTRIIPIQIEGRENPKSPINTRIIPIQVEGGGGGGNNNSNNNNANSGSNNCVQQRRPVYVHNKFNSPPPDVVDSVPDQTPRQLQTQQSWGAGVGGGGGGNTPVQSRSFRVLQKITDTDNPEGVDPQPEPGSGPWSQQQAAQQLRKLQLSDDDRALMNKFKAQVDEDTFLHTESDPRYRGAAIPSRAFRMLQTMTDGPDYVDQVARAPTNRGPQARTVPQPQTGEGPPQPYIPPSEQQVTEPRKYTGGAIPSRSFRMLQAMTANPDNCDTTDGRDTPIAISHESGGGFWGQYDPNNPPFPPYWWGYYQPSDLETPPQYWDPYQAMYAYMAEMNAAYGYPPIPYPPVYSPHPFSRKYPQGGGSDSDGYSSTDEMAYYGANFGNRGAGTPVAGYNSTCTTPSIVVTPTPECQLMSSPGECSDAVNSKESDKKPVKEIKLKDKTSERKHFQTGSKEGYGMNNKSDDEETSDSDTEVEEEEDEEEEDEDEDNFDKGLQAIRSVSDINIYQNNSSSDVMSRDSEGETEREEDTDEEEEEDEEYEGEKPEYDDDGCLPHQLSVIFEESEHSDVESVRKSTRTEAGKTSEDGDSSTTTLDNGYDDSDGDYDVLENENSTVTVRLPLKLKFSRSENDEEVTTVIVGDSQVKRSEEEDEREDPDISVTLSFPSRSNSSNQVENCKQADVSADEAAETCKVRRNIQSPIRNLELGLQSAISSCDSISRQVSMSDIDSYETAESDSDVSVCLSLSLNNKKHKNVPTRREDEDKTEESESSHWEDDSSSTSVQTVMLKPGHCCANSNDTTKGEDSPCVKQESNLKSDNGDFYKNLKESLETIEKSQGTNKSLKLLHELQENKEIIVPHNTKNRTQSVSEDEESESSESEDESSSSNSSAPSFVSSQEPDADKRTAKSKNKGKGVTTDESDNSDNEIETSVVGKPSNKKFKKENAKSAVNKVDEGNEEEEEEGETELIVKKIYELCTRQIEEDKDGNQENGLGKKRRSSEEESEDDSGVTSDMSRQISDADTEPECQLTKCQRVSTHSRLFKLLQDECGKSDDEDDEEESQVGKLKSRRGHLTLPLRSNNCSDPDSLSSSSGVTSPASPTVTDRLVKELVQSLLQRKKGRRLKKLPLAKLHAAALRILQEDMDPYDTMSSSAGSEDGGNNAYLSPVQSHPQHSNSVTVPPPAVYGVSQNVATNATMYGVNNNTAANPAMYGMDANVNSSAMYAANPNTTMYGANYYDYCDYYNSWANAAAYYGTEEYDIMPSRAFKLLREHAQPGGFSTGVINGLWAKCPRIPSSKNLHKDFLEVVDEEKVDPDPSQARTLTPTRQT